EESECVSVLMEALGRITGTETSAGDQAETIPIAPSTRGSLTMDPAPRERAMAYKAEPPDSLAEADAVLAPAQSQTLVGMLTLAGVAGESMVQDAGWTMMDIGKRIERGLGLTALLAATVTTVRGPAAGRTIIQLKLFSLATTGLSFSPPPPRHC